jgi:hypothetical protein
MTENSDKGTLARGFNAVAAIKCRLMDRRADCEPLTIFLNIFSCQLRTLMSAHTKKRHTISHNSSLFASLSICAYHVVGLLLLVNKKKYGLADKWDGCGLCKIGIVVPTP